MSAPVIKVWLGLTRETGAFVLDSSILDTDFLGSDSSYVWTDVTEWVEGSLPIGRGSVDSKAVSIHYDGGSAPVTFWNEDGRFDPMNLSGPYVAGGVTLLRFGVPAKITAEFGGVVWNIIKGFVDEWPVNHFGHLRSTVTVMIRDSTERLKAADLPALSGYVGGGDSIATRINRILDRIGWPLSDRKLDSVSMVSLQSTVMAQPAWTEILLAADSDSSHVWLDRDGKVVYTNRLSVPSAPSVVFGNANLPGVIPIENAVPSKSPFRSLRNSVSVGRAGSTSVYVENLDSQAKYGIRSWGRNDLLCSNDEEVLIQATWILSQFSEIRGFDVEQITCRLLPDAKFNSEWLTLINIDIGDRVRVLTTTVDGRTVSSDGIVSAISWVIDPAHGVWEMTLGLASCFAVFDPFILDDSTKGVLDSSLLGL